MVKSKPSARIANLEGQPSFEEIKKKCIASGKLFEDTAFPAADKSVFYSYPPDDPIEWKRPKEICDDPRMFVGGASRFDVKQGDLGNCWFLAAVSSLCMNKDLLNKVVPPDNSLQEDYAGVVHFNFWQYGRWIEICIDDRLPTVDGQLVFMHSAENNEFWSALLEKAYAKLNGSYEALKGGNQSEAMEDFTGGVNEYYDFKKAQPPANLFQIMVKAHARASLMGCSIEAKPGQIEAELPNGLIMGHAYSITDVKEFNVRGKKIPMLRIRNPWGNECEWKGAWGDSSPEWKKLSDAERKRLGLTFDDDGEFWMAFDDFLKEYNKLEICNLGPDALTDEAASKKSKKRWEAESMDGSWVPRVNAGGCRNYLDSFWTNPQYRVEVVDADEDDDDNTGTILVALMQKERRKKKKEGLAHLTMGYSIYQLPDEAGGPLDLEFFKYNGSVAKAPSFSNMREICGRHKLPPGKYVVIPSTFKPQEEGEYLLRLFSEKPNVAGEMDEETGFEEDTPQDDKKKAGTDQGKAKTKQRVNEVSEDDMQEERNVRELFKKTSGEDREVDAYELRDILNQTFKKEFVFDGFSLETCRSMVAMMDEDRSGKLGYDEFKTLWNGLRKWKKIFKEMDADKSGNMNSFELRQALNVAGYKVSNATFNALVMRYSDKDGKIFFDDFILCAVRIKSMFEIYKAAKAGGKEAHFPLDQFIQTTMYS